MRQIMVARQFPAYHPRAGEPTQFVEKILNSTQAGDNSSYYFVKCKRCGYACSSVLCAGGGQIADTGDYDDIYCPKCGSVELDDVDCCESYYMGKYAPKHHTIRSGKCWANGKERKTGDIVNLKVWSGRPYNFKTITITPPLELTVFDVEIDRCLNVDINGKYFTTLCEGWRDAELLAKNDGLSVVDMQNWFQVNAKNFKGFTGQILVWGDVSYNQTPVLPPDTDIIDRHKIE